MNQADKANQLLKLHTSEEMLVLPNIWNPIGARALEENGYPAVATASAAVSSALGYQDGERIKKSTLLDMLTRISNAVQIPVTADIESGYGNSDSQLKESINEFIETGIVGINIEDSIEEGEMRTIDQQCRRISAVREVSRSKNIHMVINARIDSFLSETYESKEAQFKDALLRAEKYVEAGADCIFPVGLSDLDSVKRLREGISSPLNILATPSSIPLSELRQLGIDRVSFGPFIFRSCFQKFLNIVSILKDDGGYECINDETISGDNIQKYLSQTNEK